MYIISRLSNLTFPSSFYQNFCFSKNFPEQRFMSGRHFYNDQLPINKYYTVVPITLGHPFYNENVTLWRGTI